MAFVTTIVTTADRPTGAPARAERHDGVGFAINGAASMRPLQNRDRVLNTTMNNACSRAPTDLGEFATGHTIYRPRRYPENEE